MIALGASVEDTHQNKKTMARNHAKSGRRGGFGDEKRRKEEKAGGNKGKRGWRDPMEL
jgi:hypothetical protein